MSKLKFNDTNKKQLILKGGLYMKLFVFWTYVIYSGLLCSTNAQDISNQPPSAKALIVKGEVFFEGKKINTNDIINNPGLIVTGEKAFIKLFIAKWGNEINIAAKSEMELNFSDSKKYTLVNGSCRWITSTKKLIKESLTNDNKAKGSIFTRSASMGVRGTDFLLISNALLGETEIVLFDGSVEFTNLKDENNKIIVSKNQWGGIGGRFGQKIAPVINLTTEQIDIFKTQLKD